MSKDDKRGSEVSHKSKGGRGYLSISPNGASAVAEQLGHVVVAGELPQAGLQVQVPVEPQRAGSPEGAAELVRGRVADDFWVLGGVGEEAVASLDLGEVQQVRAAVVADTGSVRAQRELEVREGPGGHYGQHT